MHGVQAVDVPPRVSVSVESLTTGVAIVDVKVGSQSTSAPLHWRAGDWTKPPLDISLSPEGFIEGIQVVFQDEALLASEKDADRPPEEPRIPRFEVGQWTANRYLDYRAELRVARFVSGELSVSIGQARAARLLRLAPALRVGIDSADCLARIVIGPLDTGQWRLIEAAAPA
jgi:hypothetical protein